MNICKEKCAPCIFAQASGYCCSTVCLGRIETRPTVELKRGRWKPHPYEREYDVCTNCQTGVKRREYGLNDDGSEWVTEASYRFCPYCGAKMTERDE